MLHATTPPTTPASLRANLPSSRSLANTNLATTLGIANGFTTMDPKSRRAFTAACIKSMKVAPDMDELAAHVAEYARVFLQETGFLKEMVLADYVRAVTLAFALKWIYFPHDTDWDPKRMYPDLAFVGREINRLWIACKGVSSPPKWAHQIELHAALGRLLAWSSEEVATPESNPLNMLIPAWETTWRVVLRGVLELLSEERGLDSTQRAFCVGLMKEYAAYANASTFTQRQDMDDSEQVSPEDIVKELLRLYPPTRRIHRVTDTLTSFDIEALHRSSIFNPSTYPVDKFMPWRTHHLAAEAAQSFAPFGFDMCPAGRKVSGDFGNKSLGVLVGAVCTALKGWRVCGDVEREGALRGGRKDYEDVVVVRVD